jgi:hypothetical protein
MKPRRPGPREAPYEPARLVLNPTFIFSSIRSGSTLLRCILNSHSEICAPIEMHLRDLRVSYVSSYAEQSIRALGLDRSELHLMLWDAVLARTLVESGKSLIVDKTPANIFSWREICNYWPSSRNILLLRHPNDVMRSAVFRQRETSPALADEEAVSVAEKFLRAAVDAYNEAAFHVIRYEELVENPEDTLRTLCSYLNVHYQPRMIDYGLFDHGPTGYGFGDNAGKIFTGKVQPKMHDARETPFARSLQLAKDLGYSNAGRDSRA